MIKVTVIAVGRLKEKYLTAACDEYLKRLSAYSKVNIVEINEERCSDNPSYAEIARVIEKEGERIISKIPKGSYVIPLCIEGSQLSSEDFSKKLESASLSGFGEVTFIIGGSFGLSNDVKSLAKFKLSFSKMTLPHQLMRVVLLEQIYRAFSISNNGKYHK